MRGCEGVSLLGRRGVLLICLESDSGWRVGLEMKERD